MVGWRADRGENTMPRSTVPNPNHHLWRNGRLWWIAFTVIYDGWRQERVRRSLGTADLEEARGRRDDLLCQYAAHPQAEVVALRHSGGAFSGRDASFAPPSSFGAGMDGSLEARRA
jgi:hypothetical protein